MLESDGSITEKRARKNGLIWLGQGPVAGNGPSGSIRDIQRLNS
jgi:hypothetical protein